MSAGEEQLLQLCPRCQYNLRGLPVAHACPECGLQFDRRWKILAGPTSSFRNTGQARLVRGLMIAVAPIVVVATLGPLFLLRAGGWLGWTVIAVSLPIVGVGVWLAYRKPRRFVAIGPNGLVIYQGGRTIQYHLAEIGTARYKVGFKCVVIDIGDETVSLPEYAFFPGAVFEAEACAREINRYLRGTQATDVR